MTLSERRRPWLVLALIVVIVGAGGAVVATRSSSTTAARQAAPKSPFAGQMLVGMGDSYASGEGLPPFEPGTDSPDNRCHRSVNGAFPVLAARDLGMQGRNVACSGATTDSMLQSTSNNPSQTQDLNSPNFITVMIGGNDIRALGLLVNPPAESVVDQRIDTLRPKLVATYKRIQAAAPNARIYAVGYPRVVAPERGATPNCGFNDQQVAVLAHGAKELNTAIIAAANSAGVRSIDLTNAFGGHELCTADPFINGINIFNITASLHPTQEGQERLAEVVAQNIKQTNPGAQTAHR